MADTNTLDYSINSEPENKKEKKKHPKLKYLLYVLVILIATGVALFLSLYQDFDGVMASLSRADYRYILVMFGIVALSWMLEGLIIFIFSRLYTRKYKYHQGLATAMVGCFYSAITPGASGGQVMQAYTMKKQGVEVSNAASIMIMSFIVYQLALITLGIISLFSSAGELIFTIGSFHITFGDFKLELPAIPLTIAGFLLNLFVILGLFLMSYSHKFHNFIMHHGINLFAKLKIIKNPEEKRESLRIQVENFKIELRRLLSNIPVLVLVFILFSLILILRFSLPFFAGIALDGYGYRCNIDGTLLSQAITDDLGNTIGYGPVLSTGQIDVNSFWQSVFLSSYHQMATGLIPLPGSAGVSEYFFNIMFENFFVSQQVTSAAQIIWRFSSFHVVLLVSGIVSATYRSSPKNEIVHANRKTFVTMQLETYEYRKSSSDTMFETAVLSRKEIQNRLKNFGKKSKREDSDYFEEDNSKAKPKKIKEPKVVKEKAPRKKKEKKVEEKFDSIDLGD